MLEVDTLDALDLSLWFEGSAEAAESSGCSASTTSRRLHQALACFQLTLRRGSEGWALLGDRTLIGMQRTVHQCHRLMGARPLRLHLPLWSRSRLEAEPPPGWLLNPCHQLLKGDPLQLLRDRVIDACVVTPTQLANHAAAGLHCFELYTSPIELHGLSLDREQPLHARASFDDLIGCAPLEPPAFLPLSCRLASFDRHLQLLEGQQPCSSGSGVGPWRLCYLTPEMATLLPGASPLAGLSLEWTYREQLVVLATHREHPRLLALVEQLRQGLAVGVGGHEKASPAGGRRNGAGG